MAENGRDSVGRFAPGHAGGPGRPRYTIGAAIRRLADPDAIARFVLGVLENKGGEYSMADRRWAAEYVADRAEGKPVSTVDMRAQIEARASSALPVDFHALEPEQRARVLDELRRRALAGGDA